MLLETEKIAGLVTEHGGPTSHAAIFARSLEIPAVSGVPRIAARLRPEDELIVDGLEGVVIVRPDARRSAPSTPSIAERYRKTRGRLDELRGLPSETRDGRKIRLVGEHRRALRPRPGEALRRARASGSCARRCSRSASRGLPDEDEQQRALPARRRRRSRPIRW